jgi:hypothetical protein
MGRHFFTGGLMPSERLLDCFRDDLRVVRRWNWNGAHYGRTSDAWLANMDRNKAAVRRVLAQCYGEKSADRWVQRWRVFFMACAELFHYDGGKEWYVTHMLFQPTAAAAAAAADDDDAAATTTTATATATATVTAAPAAPAATTAAATATATAEDRISARAQ